MSSWPVLSLEEAARVDPTLVGSLQEVSLDYFIPACRNVSWTPERVPRTGGKELMLLASQQVSRAWNSVFIKVFYEAWNSGGRPGAGWSISPMTHEITAPGPITMVFHLGLATEDHRAVVELVNAATQTANALVAEAETLCKRDHEELARELGLDRPAVGF